MIFITGAESFIGKAIVSRLERENIPYVGIDLVKSRNDKIAVADIRDKDIGSYIPEETRAVIHLAAISRDSDCQSNPVECLAVNLLGTQNLIEAAKTKNAKNFIFASSEWVYNFDDSAEKMEDVPIDQGKHKSLYAFSKLAGENLSRISQQGGDMAVTILRYGIVYGPRENNWSAVESLFNKVAEENYVEVGSLETARRFIHVDDIADATVKAVELQGYNILNIQGSKLVTLGDILENAAKIHGRQIEIRETAPENKSVRWVSSERAKQLMSWEAGIDIEEGLRSLI